MSRIPPTTLLVAAIESEMARGATAETFRGEGNVKGVYRLLSGETSDPFFSSGVDMIRAMQPEQQAATLGSMFDAVTVSVARKQKRTAGIDAARDSMVAALSAAGDALLAINEAAKDHRLSPSELTENMANIERLIEQLRDVQSTMANTPTVRLARA